MTKIVFLGSPEVAVTSLKSIQPMVGLVITQPDRAKGRSARPVPTPVKQHCLDQGIEVVEASDSKQVADALELAMPFDAGVVVAFGNLLNRRTLSLSRLGYLNVHFSLLPRWRGAAPVQASIAAGDSRTGVSLMELDAGLDTGPVIACHSVAISDSDDGNTLTERLGVIGASLLARELKPWLAGARYASIQGGTEPTYAQKIRSADRRLDISAASVDLARRVRALAPSPGAFFETATGPMKILAAESLPGAGEPGRIDIIGGAVLVGTGSGLLRLETVQPAGKRPMPATDWARGTLLTEVT